MKRFSVDEVEKNWNVIKGIAKVEPVFLTENGEDILVVISVEEYNRLKALDV